jgi:2-polyprenyl-3-methyl-5-hydroxy-6-metoxy-1,4-benzoquinol methylase
MIGSISKPTIRIKQVAACPLCNNPGRQLYTGLVDRLFSAPGVWGNQQCLNADCGLVWLNPAPITDDLHLAYASYYTHAGDAATIDSSSKVKSAWQGYRALVFGEDRFPASFKQKLQGAFFFLLPNRRPAVEYPIRQLEGLPAGKVLEIGCGAGDMLHSMKEQGWQAIGIDFDSSAVAAAKSKGLDVRLGDLSAQSFLDASFDVVLMNHVIEHLPYPIETLREIKRILTLGGRLIGITPNVESWGHKRFSQHWRGLEPPRHLLIFTQSALSNVLEREGFGQVEVKVSVMSAIQILKESLQLRSPSQNMSSITTRLHLEVIWMWEWVLILMGKKAGEILVFVAEKKK